MPRFTSKEFFTTHDPSDHPVGVIATGGTKIIDAIYAIHVFESSGSFVIDRETSIDYLVVAGGGGGSDGGGGAGGLLTGTLTINPGTYTVTIGGGGGSGSTGGTSSMGALISTSGGGSGGGGGANGGAGGSGGGGGRGPYYTGPATVGGTGVAGPPRQGYDGGAGYWQNLTWSGGGGGAGGLAVYTLTIAGITYTQNWEGPCIGGPGYRFTTGSFKLRGDISNLGYYASGGTGYNDNGFGEVMMPRQPGGGGSKQYPNGQANTGGGGGSAGAGGSGIVLVKYRR